MTTIALIGAGGKMGYRLSSNLQRSDYTVSHVELSDTGRQRLSEGLGISCVDAHQAIPDAQVVILAVPDTLVGRVAEELSPLMASGTMVITLDAAAPFAGHLPSRDDLVYFVTHPCHPPIFNDETDLDAKRDYFGGAKAKQHIVNALMQGPEELYALGEAIAKTSPGGRIECRLSRWHCSSQAFLKPYAPRCW